MPAVQRDLYIEQGATYLLRLRWRKPDITDEFGVTTPGDPYDLTDFSARMQIRQKQSTPALVDATTANSKIHFGIDPENPDLPADPTNGRIEVELSDEDTDLLTSKVCKYDLEVEDADGRVYRLLQGSVTVDPNITQDPGDPPVGG
jgi:hypothetical protein